MSAAAAGRRRVLYLLLAYPLLALLLGGAFLRGGAAADYDRLAQSGVRIVATIESTECENHGRYQYAFVLKGSRFTGLGQGGDKPCSELRKGDAVDVVYLPTQPSLSVNGDPAARYRNELMFAILAGTVLPAVLLFNLFRILNRRLRA